jgi:hypothetical protein
VLAAVQRAGWLAELKGLSNPKCKILSSPKTAVRDIGFYPYAKIQEFAFLSLSR